jgi:hypothetical protein
MRSLTSLLTVLSLSLGFACDNELEPLGATPADDARPDGPRDDDALPPGEHVPPPPPPEDGADTFDSAPLIACGQLVPGNVGASPEWYRLDTSGRTVDLTLHGDADVDLHVTHGPNIPDDVIVTSAQPGGHEVARVTDRGVVGVRVLLYGGADVAHFTLAIECPMDDPPADDPPADDPPVDDPPPPPDPPDEEEPPPGVPPSGVDCIVYTERNSRSAQGAALEDIVQHLPDDQVDYYCDPDLVTCAHEVSHGIHAHLRNYFNPNNARSNAFYILSDRACFVVEPGILKHEATPFVPQSLREFRFGTYVSGQSAWDDTPLYLWDEWNAYINGGEAALDMADAGQWNEGWRDQSGVIEFVGYGLAVGMAVAENDPNYLLSAEGEQFKNVLAYFTQRSLDMHRRFAAMNDFQSETSDALYDALRTSSDAAAMRQFLADTFGAAFRDEVLAL